MAQYTVQPTPDGGAFQVTRTTTRLVIPKGVERWGYTHGVYDAEAGRPERGPSTTPGGDAYDAAYRLGYQHGSTGAAARQAVR